MTDEARHISSNPTALILSGGGARGAYQVGVLKAISELFPKHTKNPFSIICGTSAGAINAVAFASSSNNLRLAAKKLEKTWSNLSVEKVYKVGAQDIATSLLRLARSTTFYGSSNDHALALLDNSPLRQLLAHTINFPNIQRRIDAGYLDAVAVTASCYDRGESMTFFQGLDEFSEWQRNERRGVRDRLRIEHLMASSAIPTILPAERIGQHYFGDGALRHISPISPALHLGAEKVLIIGVAGPHRDVGKADGNPSLAQMVGSILNSAFIDGLQTDFEHLVRINDLLAILEELDPERKTGELRRVTALAINPRFQFNEVALDYVDELPWAIRKLFVATGAARGSGSSLATYLLFESGFCKALIKHGYEDAMQQKEELLDFFGTGSGTHS